MPPRQRSRTGCAECRRRKIKCDEHRPICGQCYKSRLTCIAQTRFRPHVFSFSATSEVRQSSPSHSDRDDQDDGVSFQEESRDDNSSQTETQQDFRVSSVNHSIDEHMPATNLCHPSDIVLDQAPARSNVQHAAGTGQPGLNPVLNDDVVSDGFEEKFFIRHFSEHIAPWLDVVNFQRYFGHECIVMLQENSLLRYATCALAGKQLGQCSMSIAQIFSNATQRHMAQQLLQNDMNFLWYGAKYYDKAIKTLVREITPRNPCTIVSPPGISPVESLAQSEIMSRAHGEDPIVRLLATCILIQYESLSGNSRGWAGHLDGFDKLLALLDSATLLHGKHSSQQVMDASSQRALRAAFWWYVVNDMEESFVSRRGVRIDLENVALWRHMGLHMQDDGELIDLDVSDTPDAPPHLQDDLLSFALLRLVSKLVNVLAVNPSDRHHFSNNVATLQGLQHDFEQWSLCSTSAFRADSTSDLHETDNQSATVVGAETWFSHSFRAVTMLYYHMARMLLLINQPPNLANNNGAFDLLLALRDIEHQLQSQARDIISIAIGMHDYGDVRVRAVQPLYVAGRSLTTVVERRRLISIIRSIQDDLGLVCEYRVEDLIQEWGVTHNDLGIAERQNERWSSEQE